jgi:ppGpp synthetase/RelA/SpoT-type nucleotidyltranferase
MAVDGAWLKEQESLYRKEYPVYKAYADSLRRVLEEACATRAPNAIVQVRAKSLSSFAQKIIRKYDKYPDPVHHFTDLCGARVITSTQEESDRVCRFIRESFRIDEANSEDAKSRLRTGEFGYLSVHYIVQIRSSKLLGIDIPPEIGDRKAEVQVRTFLQHAWSVMAHDHFYKSEFVVPKPLERDMARVAALLEGADGEFERVLGSLGVFTSNYGVHMTPEERKEEMARRISVLENEPEEANKPMEALDVARLAKISGDWEMIVKYLSPHEGVRGKGGPPALLLELGHALCRANTGWSRGRKVDVKKARKYRKGQALLEEVGIPDKIQQDCAAHSSTERDETRARALYTLAWSYENVPGEELKARELYHKAYCCDPLNPYHLASFIEFEILCNKDRSFVPMLRPALLKAIEACRTHADAGIELPWAFLTMGRFLLLLGHPYESLSAYAKGIHLCLSGKVCAPDDVLDAETDFLRRINFGQKYPLAEQWVADILLLAKALKPSGGSALEEIRNKALRKRSFLHPVVIVAGGAHADFQNEMEGCKGLLERTFDRFSGTIISGGTTAGIPGIVGGLAQRLADDRGTHVDVIGYLPRSMPKHVQMDRRYHELIDTEGADFSPHQPLMNWFDLVAAGVKPSDVNVLGINGGRIAAFEYRLALALGAKVGVVEASGRAASELLPDADWWNVPGFFVLPCDPMTIRAFVHSGEMELDQNRIDKMARAVHENFLEENRWKNTDPAMMPWESLREDLKHSNREQAAYIEETLGRAGYGVRQLKGKIGSRKLAAEDVEIMAEMEHGRWVVERLRSGWRYGSKRNPANRISPFIRPWSELPEDVKNWDRNAVRNFPRVLAKAGLEIFRKRGS